MKFEGFYQNIPFYSDPTCPPDKIYVTKKDASEIVLDLLDKQMGKYSEDMMTTIGQMVYGPDYVYTKPTRWDRVKEWLEDIKLRILTAWEVLIGKHYCD